MRDIHDRRYKYVFSHPKLVEKLLTSFVHENFIKDLDFSRMTKLDKSYVTEDMQKFESDIVYEIYFKDKPVYIYLLMEFQSSVDKKMPLRFLRYILELYEDNGKSSESGLYPVIFPLLLYNGEAKWTAESNIKDVIETTIPAKYIPNFEYYPILINEINKNTLLSIHNSVSAIFYMENTESEEYHKALDDLVTVIRESTIIGAKVFEAWFNNLLFNKGIELSDAELQKINKTEEVLPMLAASLERYEEKLVKQGLEQGLEKGKKEIAINLLKEGADLNFTSKITGLTIEKLKKLNN